MMMFKYVLLAVVVVNYATMVAGHGWMMDPVPRSGGGAGTGNASTQGPCGKTGSTTPTAEWVTDQTVTVLYKRANSHGVTGPTVTFRMSETAGPKTNPANSDFNDANSEIVADDVVMDTTVNTAQSHSFQVPDFNLSVDTTMVLQFRWQPINANGAATGSPWFDCAWVTVRAPPQNNPCDPANPSFVAPNGGCSGNATCTPTTAGAPPVCDCRVGFTGDGITCEQSPPPIGIALLLDVSDEGKPSISQDQFTANVAFVLGVPPARVLFDRVDDLRSLEQERVHFAITADDDGNTAEAEVLEFRNLFLTDDEKLDRLDVSFVALEIANDPRVYTYVQGGQPLPGSSTPSSSPSGGAIAGIVIGVIIGAAVLVALIVGAVVFMKRRSSNSFLPAYQPTKETIATEQAYAAPAAAPYSAPAPAPYSAPTPAPKPAGGQQWNRSGQTYDRSNNYA